MANILDENYGILKTYKCHNKYHVFEFSENNNNIILKYYYNLYSSKWINDKSMFISFANKFEVSSGGWYGKRGRWRALKRIEVEIICKGINSFKKNQKGFLEYISFYKPLFLNKIKVEVGSDIVGYFSFSCKEIIYSGYNKLMFFDKKEKKFIEADEYIEKSG